MKSQAVKYGIIAGAAILFIAAVVLTVLFGLGYNTDSSDKNVPEKVSVPAIMGKNIADAERLLGEIGFSVSVTEEYDHTVLKDRVISQEPTAGKKVDYGTEIKLVVSKGREQVTLPNLMGKTAAEAELELVGLGFSVEKGENYSNLIEKGRVMAQSVAAGKQADKGSDIVIIISKGQDLVKVPSVKGMTLEKAEQTLKDAGLKVNTEIKCSSSIAEGKIISQDIGSNKTAPRDSAVTVTVSAGVANVKGTNPSNATQFGKVTSQGNWIYFCGSDHAIYRMRRDKSETQCVYEGPAIALNVVGEWIYFSDGSYEGGIYKIRLDGTGKTKLNSVTSYNVYAEGDWIYYTGEYWGGKIYKMKTDGSSVTEIVDEECRGFIVYDGYVYYLKNSDSLVYKCDLSGKRKSLVCAGFGGNYLTIVSNKLAVADGSDIQTVNISGGNLASFGIYNVLPTMLNGNEGWIYYVESDTRNGIYNVSSAIYKVRPDGTGKTKLLDYEEKGRSNAFINVVDGWIYFENAKQNNDLYRVRTDGKGLERVG